MKLFQKLGIVESNEEELNEVDFATLNRDMEMLAGNTPKEVDIDTSNLVTPEEIYISTNLTDLSKSIFKVDEIKKVLPASMTEETKKQSVIGMMQVSGITVEEVVNDANARTEALLGTLEASTSETENIIAEGEHQIKLHEDAIKALKTSIEERKKLQEEQNKIINAELEKVNNIKGFIL